MSMTLKIATDPNQWDKLLLKAPHRTIFHTWEWLKIVEKHTKTKLYPIIGFKGTNPIGIFPVFYQKKGFFRSVLSPPTGAGVLYLGPLIIDYENMKQGRKESTLFELLTATDKFIFSELNAKYIKIRSPPRLLDSRPFIWAGYTTDPAYTFTLNLTKNLDSLRDGFDKEFRRNIDRTLERGVSVEEGSMQDLDLLYSSVSRRLNRKGVGLNIPKDYLHELFQHFFPQNLRIFIAKYKGEKIGGIVLICYNNTVSAWIGSPKTDLPSIYPNDLIHWEAIKWAKRNGFKFYDIMDTGFDRNLSAYKMQLNPDLSIWFLATKYSSGASRMTGKLYGLAYRLIGSKRLHRLKGDSD